MHWSASCKVSVYNIGRQETCTCDDVKLVHVGDLRAVPERLAADAAIGECAADGDVEVVGPDAGREAVLERSVEDVDPQLLAADVHPQLVGRHINPAAATTSIVVIMAERAHVDDDTAWGEGLPSSGVALPAWRHCEGLWLGE
jgi:hypothetical protein